MGPFTVASLSLKTRITLFSLGIALASLWTLSYIAIKGLRRDATELIVAHQQATAAILTAQIDREVEMRLSALKQVASLSVPYMQKEPRAIQSFLEQRLGLLNLFKGSLFITGSDGVRIACTPYSQGRIGTDLNDRDYIQNALLNGKASVGKPIIARPYETPVIAMAAPIMTADTKVQGVLAGVIELSGPSFLDQIPGSLFGRTGGYLLVAPEHRLVVTASEKARILSELPAPGEFLVLDALLAGSQKSGFYVNSQGEEVLASAYRIPIANWMLLVEMPVSEVFDPIEGLKHFMLFATLMLTILVGWLTWWMARRQLSPLQNAVQSLVAQSSTGHPFAPLPIHRQDEIGRLIGGFNTVLATLGEREIALQESEARFRALHDASFGGLGIHDKGIILECNQALADMTGYSVQELIGMDGFRLIAPEWLNTVLQNVSANTEHPYEAEGVRKDGSRFHISIQGRNIPYKSRIVRVTEFRDISERKQAERTINRLAFYDQLTGLPNRQLLIDRIQHAVNIFHRHRHEGAILFFDVVHFQRINDSLGRDAGDLLLKQVAQRIVSCVREGDTVARVGSDHFVVLLEGLSEDANLAMEQAEAVSEKALAELHKTYRLNKTLAQCTVCVGMIMFNGKSEAEELLSRAEMAMNVAKSSGDKTARFFDPNMQTQIVEQAAMEMDLRGALLNSQFLLHYQIQVDSFGHPIGAEALLRWMHPIRCTVPPTQFIPIAEEAGLIVPIGEWILEAACQQLKSWADHPKLAHLTISVNVSAKQFHRDGFVAQVLGALEKSQADPRLLKLELTEGLLLSDVEGVIKKMATLKAHGVSFALDDFGTGYSSLSYLKRLPLDQLKIDQAFVRDVLHNAEDAAITRTIIALGQSLELEVIAEGVETVSQRDFLEKSGCLRYQGFLFGHPMPAHEFEHITLRSLS